MGRNFNNKLWNAARFTFMNLGGNIPSSTPAAELEPDTLADRWILSRLQRATREATERLEAYDLGGANRALYDFVWSEFCDWYLEAAKPQLYAENAVNESGLTPRLHLHPQALTPARPFYHL